MVFAKDDPGHVAEHNRVVDAGRDASSYLLVKSANDLPAAAGGEHLLPQGGVVEFAGDINLGANAIRIPATNPPVVRGQGGDTITSSATGGIIRCTNPTDHLILREFSIIGTAGPCINLTSNSTDYQLNMFFVGMFGVEAGTVSGFDVQALKDCFINAAAGLTFDGTTNKLFVSQCPFYGITSGGAITLASSYVCTVADITTSFFKFDTPGVGIVAESGYTVTDGILFGTLVVGTATPLSGLTPADVEWDMSQNTGIRDSRVAGQFHIDTSAETTIATQSTPVKVAGTTTPAAINERFSHSDNRLTYTGKKPVLVEVNGTTLTAAGDNESVSFFIAKNGSVIAASESVVGSVPVSIERFGAVIALVELETDDYVEVWMQNNDSANNFEVVGLNLTAST